MYLGVCIVNRFLFRCDYYTKSLVSSPIPKIVPKFLDDGYRQVEVGRHLGITASAIAKVRDKYM